MLSFQKVVSNGPAENQVDHSGAVVGEWPQPATPATQPREPRAVSPRAPAGSALEVANLSKSFRSGFLRRRLRGIAEVSFSVPEGSVFALLGHNGAGKTTTINCILDLVHADQGQVTIFGDDHRVQKSRARVGYLPERPYFFEHLTGRELLAFYATLLNVPGNQRKSRIEEVLGKTGMTTAAGRRLKKYSKGMLQRIGLAQALLGDPQLLILDEPMSGLDPMGRREVRQLLLDLKAQGKTIILSSHIVPDVEMLADTVGVLREGSLVLTRDLSEMADKSSYEILLQDHGTSNRVNQVTAENADALRQILDRCHDDGVMVRGVEVRSSSLEDLFLEAHQGPEVRS